jgi:hypothetical protein
MGSGLSQRSSSRSPDGAEPGCRLRIATKISSSGKISPPPDFDSQGVSDGPSARRPSSSTETDDPLAEWLVQDLIVELEDRLAAEPSPVKNSPG